MQSINTQSAPQAIGTYSQAIRCDNTIYLSGQIPLNPKTMQICSDDVRLQIIQVLDNLSAVCQAAGGDLNRIVKLSVYLTDLNDFPLINELMSQYFDEPYPARVSIGVSSLPRGAKVEMDGIMILADS